MRKKTALNVGWPSNEIILRRTRSILLATRITGSRLRSLLALNPSDTTMVSIHLSTTPPWYPYISARHHHRVHTSQHDTTMVSIHLSTSPPWHPYISARRRNCPGCRPSRRTAAHRTWHSCSAAVTAKRRPNLFKIRFIHNHQQMIRHTEIHENANNLWVTDGTARCSHTRTIPAFTPQNRLGNTWKSYREEPDYSGWDMYKNEWMNGWMDRWMGMDGWTDGRMDRWAWMDGWMDWWTDRWMNNENIYCLRTYHIDTYQQKQNNNRIEKQYKSRHGFQKIEKKKRGRLEKSWSCQRSKGTNP